MSARDYEPHYEFVPIAKVMQFYADNFKGDDVQKHGGMVACEWWIDQSRGETIFKLWVKKP